MTSMWLASGMQRRDRALGALPAVVAVVVVEADVRHLVLAEDAHEPARDRGLAGGGVADDAEDDRAGPLTFRARARSSSKTELARMSSASRVTRSRAVERVAPPVEPARPGASAPGRSRCGCCGRARSGAAPTRRSTYARSAISGLGRELVGLLLEHQRGDRHQLVDVEVGEVDVVRDARSHPRVRAEEGLHAVAVAGEHDDEVVALGLHDLEQDLDRLLAVVALVLRAVEVVRLVDEQHAAAGALEHLAGLRRGVPDVLPDEIVARDRDDLRLARCSRAGGGSPPSAARRSSCRCRGCR